MANTTKVLQAVSITDEKFFTVSEEQLEKYEDALFDLERFDTILIKAPARVDIAQKSSFPILYISQSDDYREWHVQEYRNLLVSAYNTSTGKLIARTARKDEKQTIYPPKDERSGPPPDDISTTSYGTGCEIINIKNSLDIPWQPSRYRITLICFDWVSNTADVTLHDGSAQPETNLILPGETDMTIDAILSPSQGAERGEITFSVPEKLDTNPKKFTVQGKFSIPVTSGNIVEINNAKSILIPAWLMVVGKNIDQGSATLAKWYITADMPEKLNTATIAEGIFKFSMSEILPIVSEAPFAPNDYCCYVVINGHLSGPQKCRVSE
ncbi:MAG: hypothetical protein GF398_20215 [Chitinivibrionales bacterium]|nr:hypothetical protein [Chitinivibrionales bacterium]